MICKYCGVIMIESCTEQGVYACCTCGDMINTFNDNMENFGLEYFDSLFDDITEVDEFVSI